MATVNRIPTTEFFNTELTVQDSLLLSNQVLQSSFNTEEDIVELYVYDYSKNLTLVNFDFRDWSIDQESINQGSVDISNIILNPDIDGSSLDTQNNIAYILYSFVNNKISDVDNKFFISTISADRTEITLQNNSLADDIIELQGTALQAELTVGDDFKPLYVNFGSGPEVVAVNLRVNTTTEPYRLELKLYQPLPNTYSTKSECWLQTQVASPIGFRVKYDDAVEPEINTTRLKGPNLNLKLKSREANPTEYRNKNQLLQTNLTSSTSQLNSLLEEKGIELNVNYTDYSNFVNFSSATQRLQNFYLKASLLETYQNDINIITGSSMPATQQSQSIARLQADIDRIITNFDGYDYYLYYESGSKAWPKTNSTKPYTLASTGSAEVIAWYGTEGLDGTGQLQSASVYDNENQDNLVYSIPEYIREDSDNAPYELFIEMIGQHFDNLYLYTQAITEKYNADNRLDYGISKDLVADTLRSFGVKLYENNFSTDDLYTALLGLTPSGSTLPLPNISTLFPVTGSGIEYVETIVSASSEVIPLDDLNKSIYKRLYHNLPALVKKKGTLAGLRLLINAYGIPDTILRISEFGGKDKDNSNDWDYWQREYNNKFELDGTNDFVSTEWSLNTDWNATNNVPATLAFRFKTDEVTATSGPTNVSQSLWLGTSNAPSYSTTYSAITLTYTGSAGTSGSYSGSVVDPEYQYGTLTFYPDYSDLTQSASIYLPFFDGGWWSVMVTSASAGYNVYAKNSIYNGDTGTSLGFQGSASLTPTTDNWTSATYAVFGKNVGTFNKLSGSLQELRYYKAALSESVFDDYVMNPSSIEGNSINSSGDELVFRGALGNELYTGSTSIHPKVSGEWTTTSSFASNSDITFSTGSFTDDTTVRFYDQPAVGIRNRISDKIRLDDNGIYGTTLSNQRSLIQNTPATKKYTRDTNYLEVGFSPQNEINDDIIDQIGYFNIGDYIGDPRQVSSSATSYPDLDTLRLDYFKKYSKSYNLNDYLRLIKFYDNSLFKMIKDFIPARTGAATGAIIKQTLLERNRQKPADVAWTRPEYTASIQPQSRGYESGSIEVFTGGPAGAVNDWVDINQSWTSSILTPEGLVTSIESSEREFYNGEYSGSRIDVVNGKLQDNPLLGEAYRISVPDLQNLNASLDGNFNGGLTHLDGGFYRGSGSLIFDQLLSDIAYYNTSSGEYAPNYTRVVDLELHMSAAYTQVEEDPTLFSFTFNFKNLTTGEVLGTTTYSYDNGGIFTGNIAFTSSVTIDDFTVDSGSLYGLTWSGYTDAVGDASGLTVYDVPYTSYKITVQDLSKESKYYNDPTVYAQQNLPGNLERFNDYNAIYNNVYSNRVSTKYFDVDYSDGALNPNNFEPIINQSALYAQIQDSNYDSKSAFFELRYGGTKNTGEYNFTELISSESVTAQYPVDYFTNFFAYFDWVGGSNPQYPGGGNVHCLYLINAETGDIFTLSQENKYLDTISQIFKKGDPVYMIPISGSSGGELYTSTVVEGGALYNTILYKSGSDNPRYTVKWENAPVSYTKIPTFFTSSTPYSTLIDNNQYWLYPFLTGSDPNLGSVEYIQPRRVTTQTLFFYSKKKGGFALTSDNDAGKTLLSDTYFPIQYGDFIRFGTTGSIITDSDALDGTFGGLDLVTIKDIIVSVTASETSSLVITPTLTSASSLMGNNNNQNFRIFRRTPNEAFTLVDSLTYSGPGLLIPKNLNPKYDPIKIAKEQNII